MPIYRHNPAPSFLGKGSSEWIDDGSNSIKMNFNCFLVFALNLVMQPLQLDFEISHVLNRLNAIDRAIILIVGVKVT